MKMIIVHSRIQQKVWMINNNVDVINGSCLFSTLWWRWWLLWDIMMMKIRMLTYNNNNAAQWRNDDDSDIISSSGVKWRHFRWKHVSVALIKTHIHMFIFCSGLSCRSMNINLFSSVDIKLLTEDVSWWIWSVLVFKCVKCYDSYLLRPTVLRPSRFIHVFILKVSFFSDHSQLHVWNILFLKTWRLFMAVDVSSVKTFHSDMSTKWNKIFFLVTSVSSFYSPVVSHLNV